MNLKLKTAITAVALSAGLLAAGNASAAMINTNTTGNGGVLFSGWSDGSGKSYAFGLTGVDFNTFAANPASNFSFTLTGFGSFLSSLGATGNDFRWTVGAADGLAGSGNFGGYQVLTTGPANGTLPSLNNQFVKSAGINQEAFVNGALSNPAAGCQTGGGACTASSTDAGYVGAAFKDNWSTSFSGLSNLSDPAVGTALPFYLLTSSSNTQGFTAPTKTTLAGLWTLTLSGNDGILSYTTSTVPLPAAFWLLVSGLAGFAGVARRAKTAA